MTRAPIRSLLPVLAGLLLYACGSSPPLASPAGPASPGEAASPEAPPASGSSFGPVRAVRIAQLDQPLAMAVRAGDDALYVAEQGGRVVAIRDGRIDPAPVLDVSARIDSGGEQGLLGLAFPPDGRFLYVDFTDKNGDTNVLAFPFRDGRAVGSGRRVLFVKQPFANHNGGGLAFGPDGDLYIGMGDGGSEGDPLGNGQSLRTLLGKLLRIEPTPTAPSPFTIPASNPFAGRSGARPEIWAYGLRNPWRFSFDRTTGDLWIADVGQSAMEEVDFQPAGSPGGQNYGWNRLEGTERFEGDPPPTAVPPLYEYGHDGGACAITGGYVYRGRNLPALAGAYVFGDYCSGMVSALRQAGGRVTMEAPLAQVPSLASFGQDQRGEIYALSLGGGVYRLEP